MSGGETVGAGGSLLLSPGETGGGGGQSDPITPQHNNNCILPSMSNSNSPGYNSRMDIKLDAGLSSQDAAFLKEAAERHLQLSKTCQSIETQTFLNGDMEHGDLGNGCRGDTLDLQDTSISDASITSDNQDHEHMVQNQMTPSYPAFSQTGIEEFQGQQPGGAVPTQATTPTAVAVATDPQFKAASEQAAQQQSQAVATTVTNGVEQQTSISVSQQTDLENGDSIVVATSSGATTTVSANTGPKRLHVSNIPFRFREADLRNLLGFGTILDVEIIFNERGSKGFGFVTFATSSDADRAREKLNGTVVEGRKIEVNNATARIMTKKVTPTVVPANGGLTENYMFSPQSAAAVPAISAAALRGAAFTRQRVRGPYPAVAAAAAAAALRHPSPLANAATGLPYAASVYQDPFLASAYAAERYQPYAAGYATAATRYAIPTVATAATYAAATGYGREYAADPYLPTMAGIPAGYAGAVTSTPSGLLCVGDALSAQKKVSMVPGTMAGTHLVQIPDGASLMKNQATVYRGAGYQRFAPY